MLAWDRSHDWILHRSWHDLTRVAVDFRQASPSVAQLVALRRCLPQCRDAAPAALRAKIANSGTYSLGVLPSPEARQLIESLQKQGLEVVAESASFVSYLPIDCTTGCAWLIEDEADAVAVAHAMLEAGIRVESIEA